MAFVEGAVETVEQGQGEPVPIFPSLHQNPVHLQQHLAARQGRLHGEYERSTYSPLPVRSPIVLLAMGPVFNASRQLCTTLAYISL